MTSPSLAGAARRYAETFTSLEPESLELLLDLVHEDVIFTDPFNSTRGKARFRQIFAHMFETCEAPRFQVSDIAAGEKAVYLRWRMTGRLRSWPRTQLDLEGLSEIHLDDDGLVTAHIDHWDSASQLLSRLPGIGVFIRRIMKLFLLPPARD